MLIRPDDHHATPGAVNAPQIKYVLACFRMKYFFVIPQAVFSFRRPQVVRQIVHGQGQSRLLEHRVSINDGVDISAFRGVFPHWRSLGVGQEVRQFIGIG